MIDRVLDWAGDGATFSPKTVVDVGCGIGGSTRHIARRFGASGTGITLSPYQRGRAEAISGEANLGDKVNFQVADALDMPFESVRCAHDARCHANIHIHPPLQTPRKPTSPPALHHQHHLRHTHPSFLSRRVR